MSLEQLSVLREAMEHYDWQAAFDGARDGSFADPVSEAERLDLLAEAAWWLGNLEDCISNREAAFAAWTAVGEARRSGQCAVWLYEHHLFRARPRIAQAWLRRARLVLEPHRAVRRPAQESGAPGLISAGGLVTWHGPRSGPMPRPGGPNSTRGRSFPGSAASITRWCSSSVGPWPRPQRRLAGPERN
ncbi:MAG: hypothetical protein IPG97_03680 [Microthrixaceae bacterium]|nr:hypothetical protein [Microthrixaceae bacterium]